MLRVKNKEETIKSAREKQLVMCQKPYKGISRFLSRNFYRPEGSGMSYLKLLKGKNFQPEFSTQRSLSLKE